MAKIDAERFGHRCPYTDKPCLDFACSECEVEAQEERWSEELQGESRIVAEADVIEQIRADILRYKADCDFHLGKECRGCNEVMFGSILRIIDKHTKGDASHDAQD